MLRIISIGLVLALWALPAAARPRDNRGHDRADRHERADRDDRAHLRFVRLADELGDATRALRRSAHSDAGRVSWREGRALWALFQLDVAAHRYHAEVAHGRQGAPAFQRFREVEQALARAEAHRGLLSPDRGVRRDFRRVAQLVSQLDDRYRVARQDGGRRHDVAWRY